MNRNLPGQVANGGKGNPGRGKGNAKARTEARTSWGGVPLWLEHVRVGAEVAGGAARKTRSCMALLFTQAPSEGSALANNRFRPLLWEGVGWISPSPGPSLLSHSGMFYL